MKTNISDKIRRLNEMESYYLCLSVSAEETTPMLQFPVLINRHCLDLYLSDQPQKKVFQHALQSCVHYLHTLYTFMHVLSFTR